MNSHDGQVTRRYLSFISPSVRCLTHRHGAKFIQVNYVEKVVDVPVVKQRQVPMVQKVQKTMNIPQVHSTSSVKRVEAKSAMKRFGMPNSGAYWESTSKMSRCSIQDKRSTIQGSLNRGEAQHGTGARDHAMGTMGMRWDTSLYASVVACQCRHLLESTSASYLLAAADMTARLSSPTAPKDGSTRC